MDREYIFIERMIVSTCKYLFGKMTFLNDIFFLQKTTYGYLQKSFLIFGISRIFLGDDATLLLVFLEHDFGSSKSGVVGSNSIGEGQFRK